MWVNLLNKKLLFLAILDIFNKVFLTIKNIKITLRTNKITKKVFLKSKIKEKLNNKIKISEHFLTLKWVFI